MKRKLLYIFVIVLASTLVFFGQSNPQAQAESSTNPELIPVKHTLFELHNEEDFKQLNKAEKRENIYKVLDRLPPEYKKLKRQYQIAMGSLPDITFYGRVIDQYGQPVTNAEIRYTGTNTYLSAGGGFGRTYTDSDGYFEINTDGATLELTGVSEKSIIGIGFGMPGTASFRSYDDPNGRHPNWKDYSKKENAYIVKAWRLGEYAGAIKGGTIGHFNRDGRYYTLLLERPYYDKKRRAWNQQIKEGKTDGHIYVSCTRPHMVNNRDYGDWSVHITPINGGIQETDDIYTTLAPETGYRPSLDIIMKKGSQGYKHQIENKDYYFMSNNGQQYGSLRLRISPFYAVEKEVCIIDIHYKINHTGSRNLELKPVITIQSKLPAIQKLASK